MRDGEPCLLRRFGSTALRHTSARLRNSFRPCIRRTDRRTVLVVRCTDRICVTSAVPDPPPKSQERSPSLEYYAMAHAGDNSPEGIFSFC